MAQKNDCRFSHVLNVNNPSRQTQQEPEALQYSARFTIN